jgi:hypothetical protein
MNMSDLAVTAIIASKVESHLMQVETKHPLKIGIGINENGPHIAIGIHVDDKSSILNDICGHTVKLATEETLCDILNEELLQMIKLHNDK